jgi:MoxR-like ATPase
VAQTHVSQEIAEYVVRLIDATRNSEEFLRGASPRATLSVIALAKAIACLQDRDYVVPKDVQQVFVAAIAHRVQDAPGQEADSAQRLKALLGKVRAPRLH